jgi:hypothetical protein
MSAIDIYRRDKAMRKGDIRPYSTYIGNGGVTKKVKSISMAIDGRLSVEWRLVKSSNGSCEVRWALQPLEDFAKWAKAIADTMSKDLEHHLHG